ncbi:MAG: glycosyltransferase family 39 protein [Alphaproteobacteria bacterium]|nr:glycosyltransferase family 39 protein [Alphaproteobacteria bacterium]
MSAAWWRDPHARAAALCAALVRALVLARWPAEPCVRDECVYLFLARGMSWAEGVPPSPRGWLWAPLYPALLALHERLLADAYNIRLTQVLASVGITAFGYALAREAGGPRAGRIAAWALALSPTLVFFSLSLWTETLYLLLLLGTLAGVGRAREGAPARALAPGLGLGLMVLLRGVATYTAPLFALGLLWGRWRSRRAWAGASALLLSAALVVAPYSIQASARWEGRVISDRTLGEVMWMGNNDFPPLTFDHGLGPQTPPEVQAWIAEGRPRCAFEGDPTTRDACEVAAGLAWIRANPGAFLARAPLRLSQLLNPNSFLTRHLRRGGWAGLPAPAREALIGATVGWSLLAVLGGSLGLIALGRGWLGLSVGGLLLYNLAVVAALAGSTRFRVPLDGLWILYAAALLAAPGDALARLRASRLRLAAALGALALLLPLSLRFFPVGWS